MKCLCCGKPLSTDEFETGWHTKCIKRFFGMEEIPSTMRDESIFENLAIESINIGMTVPGVQRKLPIYFGPQTGEQISKYYSNRFGFIIKPQVVNFEALPEAEHLVMGMAQSVGISVVPHALIKTGNEYSYITKRIDRSVHQKSTVMLAMEDFCQLDLHLTENKYYGSYERCA